MINYVESGKGYTWLVWFPFSDDKPMLHLFAYLIPKVFDTFSWFVRRCCSHSCGMSHVWTIRFFTGVRELQGGPATLSAGWSPKWIYVSWCLMCFKVLYSLYSMIHCHATLYTPLIRCHSFRGLFHVCLIYSYIVVSAFWYLAANGCNGSLA